MGIYTTYTAARMGIYSTYTAARMGIFCTLKSFSQGYTPEDSRGYTPEDSRGNKQQHCPTKIALNKQFH